MSRRKKSYLLIGLLAAAILAMGVLVAGRLMPAPITAAAPAAQVGMKLGERYHAVHVDGLQLKCDRCHGVSEAYYDPLAQVFNAVDKRACLGCHREGTSQPFYGQDWRKAKVSR